MSTPPDSDADDSTPLLDRLVPLPAIERPAVERGPTLFALGVGIAIVAMFGLRYTPVARRFLLEHFPVWFPGPWSVLRLVAVLFALVGIGMAVVFVHEGGHALAGLAAGFRFHSLRVGPLIVHRPLRLARHRGPGAWTGGWAQMSPARTDRPRLRGAALVLGGPLASLLAGCAALAIPLRGPAQFFAGAFGLISIAGGFGDLMPFRTSFGASDGRRLWALLQNRAHAARFLALLQLGAELRAGVPPESLSPGAIAAAVGVRDPSAETLSAHALAFAAASQQRRDADAARLLEACLAYSGYGAPAVRHALMSDAAVFQARRRRRADLAEQWLEAMPAAIRPPWLRTRAEAAILEARGDAEAARRKLDEIERAIAALPDATQRAAIQRSLGKWRSELADAAGTTGRT